MSDAKLLTRKALIEFLNKEMGIPVTQSTVDKTPPRADGYYGRQCLYSEATARAYGRSLVSEEPKKLVTA